MTVFNPSDEQAYMSLGIAHEGVVLVLQVKGMFAMGSRRAERQQQRKQYPCNHPDDTVGMPLKQ